MDPTALPLEPFKAILVLHPVSWRRLAILAAFTLAALATPNVVIIMTDDMGYSDLGCFGSEIETPNLDALAANGLRFSRFYNAGKCCPTRAALLTGLYSHQAGIGAMTRDEGLPGYRGHLNEQCVTIAEVLRPVGYHTIQTGKWHVGAKKRAWWPNGRGFDDSFGCPLGGGFYFRPSAFHSLREVMRNDEVLYTPKIDPPAGWYTTDAYTDEGLAFVRKAVAADKPFFWYLAYNAPHWPLRAKSADIAKYRGRYRVGWDEIRRQRRQRLIELGLLPGHTKLSPRHKAVPAWDSLSPAQQDTQDHIMATYAAAIDCVDQNVGKLVTALKQLAVFDDTLIVFLCDNGGSSEPGNLGVNKRKGEIGTPASFVYYGKSWANVSDTPFREFKSNMHEGGISTPFVAHWPRGIDAKLHGSIVREPAHVFDLMATCVDISGADYPSDGIHPMAGISLKPAFQGAALQRDAPLCFEFAGSRAIRHAKWKLVSNKGSAWELYDMDADPSEIQDLAAAKPETVQKLSRSWDQWASRSNVYRKKSKPEAKAETRSFIPVADLAGTVVDNRDATLTGWSVGKNFSCVGRDYLYSSDPTASAQFTLIAPHTGRFDIQLNYAAHPKRGSRVPVTFTVSETEHALKLDMRQPPSLPHGFAPLETVSLTKGQTVTVRIAVKGAGGHAHADAVRLIAR